MTENQLRKIFNKTKGHCHFCGDKIVFEKRGGKKNIDRAGYWEADHIFQRERGGKDSSENRLPACIRCNRLRWHRRGNRIRLLLFLGLIAKDEMKKKSGIGRALDESRRKRLIQNKKRRKRML